MGPATAADPPILRTERLSLRIGGAMIVDDVSLSVRRGEFVSLIGPNGAGKSSFFNLLSGLYRATDGRVEIAGRDVTGDAPARRARAGLGRSFQASSVFPALTIFENVRLAVQIRAGHNLAIWRRALAGGPQPEQVRTAIRRVGLEGRESRLGGELSHGDRHKLELAMLLAAGFEVLLLDEPTAGVSLEEVPALLEVIASLHREQGKTVLMVEHRIDVIGGLSDRVAVMHHGRLLACGRPDDVMADPAVQEAYLGDAL